MSEYDILAPVIVVGAIGYAGVKCVAAAAGYAVDRYQKFVSSTELMAQPWLVQSSVKDSSSLAGLQQRVAAISSDVGLALQEFAPVEFADATSLIEQASSAELGARTDTIQNAHLRLNDAFSRAALVVGGFEQQAVSQVLHDSLSTLGFEVTRHNSEHIREADRASGFWAIRNHQLLAIRVGHQGVMEVDTAGCSARQCEPLLAQLREEMAQRGVNIEARRIVRHGDPRGGSLIQRVTKIEPSMNPALRAAAIVKNAGAVGTRPSVKNNGTRVASNNIENRERAS